MKECIDTAIESAKNSRFPEEALGRAQFHLSKILREQGIEKEEADRLETNALNILNKYSPYASEFLRGIEDPMVMFDDLQSIFDGRFTGRQLLKYIQVMADQPWNPGIAKLTYCGGVPSQEWGLYESQAIATLRGQLV